MSAVQPVAVPSLDCRFCGKPMPSPQPLNCPNCKSFQERCSTCGHAIPPNAKRCNACKAFQSGPPCLDCHALVPHGARCGVCNAAQDIRRFFPDTQLGIALVMALISMLAATVPPLVRWWHYGSDTHVRIIGTESVKQIENGVEVATAAIRVVVANGGTGHAAIVRNARMSFDDELGIEPVDLIILNPDKTLIPPEKSEVVLLAYGQSLTRTAKTPAEVIALLGTASVSVTLEVEESGPLREPRAEKRTDAVPGGQLDAFLKEHAPV